MKILFLGDLTQYCGSAQRLAALRRLGHEVTPHDLERAVATGKMAGRIHYRTGYRLLQRAVVRQLGDWLGGETFDLAWVEGGSHLGTAALALLASRARTVVNYHNDDPTGRRDWRKWHTYRRAVSGYDLVATVREVTRRELERTGAREVIRVFMSYDDELLASPAAGAGDGTRWISEVLFAGTWMPERGPFLADLVRRGVPLSIVGDRWPQAREWNELKACYRGPAVYGPQYVSAVRGARICLGLLSKGNRDLHTIRSTEVPYIGSLLCAERTPEHSGMYEEGAEALFWSDAEECARLCHGALADEPRRAAIAVRGRQRLLQLKLRHVDVVAGILERARSTRGQTDETIDSNA